MAQEPSCVGCVRLLSDTLQHMADDHSVNVSPHMRSAAAFYADEFARLAGRPRADPQDASMPTHSRAGEGHADCSAQVRICLAGPPQPILQWRLNQLLLSAVRFHLAAILNEDSVELDALRAAVFCDLSSLRLEVPVYNMDNFAAIVTNALRALRRLKDVAALPIVERIQAHFGSEDKRARAAAQVRRRGLPWLEAPDTAGHPQPPTPSEAGVDLVGRLREYAAASVVLGDVFLGVEMDGAGGANMAAMDEDPRPVAAQPSAPAADGAAGQNVMPAPALADNVAVVVPTFKALCASAAKAPHWRMLVSHASKVRRLCGPAHPIGGGHFAVGGLYA